MKRNVNHSQQRLRSSLIVYAAEGGMFGNLKVRVTFKLLVVMHAKARRGV